MGQTGGKIAYLDGIRGVAAFLVFFHHFLLAFFSAYYTFDIGASDYRGWEVKYGQSVFSVFSNGNFCVCVFFVLSGFVLSRKYFQSRQMEVLISSANRRFLRLYIPVAATLILAYLMMKAGVFFNAEVSKLRHSEWWLGGMWAFPDPLKKLWICLKYATMFANDSSFDTSLWTMSIEFAGSMFVFAVLALTHNTRKRLLVLLLIFLYCKFTEQAITAAFVFGISLNYAELWLKTPNKYIINILALLLLLCGLFLGSYPTNNAIKDTAFEHLGHTFMEYNGWFHVVGAYFLVLAFVISMEFQRFISMRFFRFLGYISFSLYLLHPLIIGSFSSFLYLKMWTRLGFNFSVILVFILTSLFCFLVSWLMTKYIDDPGVRFSRYVYDRWFRKQGSGTDTPAVIE